MADEVSRLEIAIEAEASRANSSLDGLVNKLSKISTALSGVNSNGLTNMATGVSKLSTAMVGMQNVSTRDFGKLANNIGKLGKINSGNIFNVANAATSMSNALGKLATTDTSGLANLGGLSSLSQGFRSFGYKTTKEAVKVMPEMANGLIGLKNAMSGMANIGAIGSQIGEMASGISKLGYKTTERAIKNLPTLATEMNKFLTTMAKAPAIGNGTIRLVTAVAKLTSNLSGVSRTSRSAGNGLNLFSRHASKARTRTMSLAPMFGKLYASYFLVIRGIRALGKAFNSSIDYSETLNYFNVVMNKIGEEYKSRYKEFGYESAEEYADSFSKRITALNEKLTGYTQNSSGTLVSLNTKNLGLDPNKVMEYEATIASLTNALGMAGEVSSKSSKIFTMLAGDMSSLRNVDLADVMDNFKSGLVGMSKAVDKYGMDIRTASLQQIAYEAGVSQSVATMSQNSKVQLRMVAMLRQSRVAWGDLANTINSSANQLRMLKTNMTNLGRTIGDMFQPIIASLLPYLNAIVLVLQKFVTWVAKATGLADAMNGLNKSVGTVTDNGLSDLMDDAAGSTDGVTGATKKLKKQLDILSFDQINKLSDNSDSSSSGGGSASPKDYDFSNLLDTEMENYEKVWNKAFNSMQNKAYKIADKMVKAIKRGWENGDFTFLGSGLAKAMNNIMRSTDWKKIQETASKIAKSIATFLNGFIKDYDWKLLGRSIANGLKTAIEFAYTFVTTFDFSNIGKKIGDGINGFFEEMGEVDNSTGLNGWQKLGKTISKSIIGIADAISSALSTVNWESVGTSIGQFMASLDWIKILSSVGKAIVNALSAVVRMWASSFVADPISTTIATLLVGSFVFAKFGRLATTLARIFGGEALAKSVADNTSFSSLSDKLMTKLNTALGKTKIGKELTKTFSVLGTSLGSSLVTYAGLMIAANLGSELQVSIAKALGDNKVQQSIWDMVSAYVSGNKEKIDYSKYVFEQEKLNRKALSFDDWKKSNSSNKKNTSDLFSKWDNIGKAKEYKKNVDSLRKSMEELNVPTNIQNKYLKKLDTMYDNGKIKISDYVDVVKNHTGSAKDLKTAIDKLSSKEFKVGAVVDGKSDVEELRKSINGVPSSKDSKLNVSTSGEDSVDSLGKKIGGINDKNVKVTATMPNAESIKSGFNNLPLIKVKAGVELASNFKESLRNQFKGFAALKVPVKVGFTSKEEKQSFLMASKPLGMSMDKWKGTSFYKQLNAIKLYANGGMPASGEVFMARENGLTEMVGSIGNHSAVANNDQIVESIEGGVYRAVMAANSSSGGGAKRVEVPVYLDGKVITKVVVDNVNDQTISNNKSPLVLSRG